MKQNRISKRTKRAEERTNRTGKLGQKYPKQKKRHSKAYLRKRTQRNLILAGMLGLCMLILFGVSSLYFWQYVKEYDNDVIAKGIYISDVNAGGMTTQEAEKALNAQIEKYQQAKVTVTLDGKTAETTLADLKLETGGTDRLLKKAMNYGKVGNIWKRYIDIRKIKKGKKVFQPTYTVDVDKVDDFIESKCEEMQIRATDATLSVSGEKVTIADEIEGTIIDNKTFVTKLKSTLNSDWHGKDVSVKLTTTVDKPEVTAENLTEVKDVLGSYSTDVGGTTNRKKNVKNSAEQVSGTLILPGEEVSVNEQTLPHTKENGYFEANAYENGEIVQSLAGGICQMCTTVYNAVLYAELDVTQRQPHSMIVSYVDPSRDAAIAGDYKDLKFVNNTETPIYIYCSYVDDVLTVKIYGKETRPENREIKLKSVTKETKDPGDPKYVANPDERIGSYYVSTSAHKGVEAELWKYVYIDGKEESKEQVNSSSYAASGATISVGVKSSNAEAVDIVKSAIASQDRATIKSAIARAQSVKSSSSADSDDEEDDN